MIWKTCYLVVTALLFINISCNMEVDTKIILTVGTLPPTFVLKGSGHISRFVIYGPLAGEYSKEDDRPVAWKIFPNKESASKSVSELPPIKYGEVPIEWTQHTPENGDPAPLAEGANYRVVANTNSASSGYMDFIIHEGKVKSVNR